MDRLAVIGLYGISKTRVYGPEGALEQDGAPGRISKSSIEWLENRLDGS
jgi:hypothetical protein